MSDVERQCAELLMRRYVSGVSWKTADPLIEAPGVLGFVAPGRTRIHSLAVARSDLAESAFEDSITQLAEARDAAGRECPLDLFPSPEAYVPLVRTLEKLRLAGRTNISVFVPPQGRSSDHV